MEVELTKLAKQDILEIHTYYLDAASKDIADDFYFDVSGRLRFLGDFQELGSLKYSSKEIKKFETLRFLKLKRFPYLLFFTVNHKKNVVSVETILHEKRNIPELLQ